MILKESLLIVGRWLGCWIVGKCMWFRILFCLGFDISGFRYEIKASFSNVNIVTCSKISRLLDSRKVYVVLDSLLPRI